MTQVELYAASSGGRIGTLGSAVIGVYDGVADLGLLDHLERLQAESAAKYGKFSSLSIVATPRVEAASAEYRARSAALASKFQPSIVGAAIVILSSGGAAVVARTFLAAYALLVPQDSPLQTFKQVAPAAKWLQELPDQHFELKNNARFSAAVEAFVPRPLP